MPAEPLCVMRRRSPLAAKSFSSAVRSIRALVTARLSNMAARAAFCRHAHAPELASPSASVRQHRRSSPTIDVSSCPRARLISSMQTARHPRIEINCRGSPCRGAARVDERTSLNRSVSLGRNTSPCANADICSKRHAGLAPLGDIQESRRIVQSKHHL